MNLKNILYTFFGFTQNYCDYTDEENLFVRFTNYCPNHCSFCFDKECFHNTKNISGKKLAEIANSTKRKHIMLSGGEPCFNMKRLEEFVDNLDEDVVIESLMTSLPKQAYINKEILFKIIERCAIIDISTHGNNNADDEEIYQHKLGYDKHSFIKELAEKFPTKVFVSCVMQKSKFNSLTNIIERINIYNSECGVINFYFNELGNTKVFESEPEYISINDLIKNFNKTSKIKIKCFRSAYAYGCKVDLSNKLEKILNKKLIIKIRRRCYRCGSGDHELSWLDIIKIYLLKQFKFFKYATPVLNENGKISDWFKSKH